MVDSNQEGEKVPPGSEGKVIPFPTTDAHKNSLLGELRSADAEMEQLPPPMQEQITKVYEAVWQARTATIEDPQARTARAEELARATRATPAYPHGEPLIGWSSNVDAYKTAVSQIELQYRHDGKFDKEGFVLAASAEMFKLASSKANQADRATFANTLFLMTQVGLLGESDIAELDTITKTIPEAWKILCAQTGQTSEDDMTKLTSLTQRVNMFSHTQLVDKESPASIISRMQNSQGNANVSAFRTAYEGQQQAKAA